MTNDLTQQMLIMLIQRHELKHVKIKTCKNHVVNVIVELIQ